MSIHDSINAELAGGSPRLRLLERALPSDPSIRTMLISDEIKRFLDGPWENDSIRYRSGRLRADLEDFIKGAHIAVSLVPFDAKSAFMGRLNHVEDGFWDIRSRDPSPAIRIVGAFAETDMFIALRWAPRSRSFKWAERPPLGPRDSREWRDIVVQCKADWRNLFHPYPPVTGDDVHAYISDAVHVV